ncbi:MAG: lipopolysaccharide assembly protein LapB [Proteobacteria bacterium]|nr:lipopolysaccharide assembly protein LapB [Pseudomonadota bacterium]
MSSFNLLELICLLLPIAALSGWYLGKRSQKIGLLSKQGHLSSDYYVGLNFLLNEQTDKAVDAFIRMLDVSPDSVETTVALGNFFRRRGEVDRAIRIHQSLISKPSLTPKQRSQSLLALAQDYIRSGMYDRAELLLLEITNIDGVQLEMSLRLLIDIYEREKDWEKAIQFSVRLQEVTKQSMSKEIAQYYCENAENAWSKGKIKLAFKYLKQGLQQDRHCTRISFLEGNFEKKLGKYQNALQAYKRIEFQDLAFLPEALNLIIECYEQLEQHQALEEYLDYLLHHCPSISIVLAHAEKVKEKQGKGTAAQFLADYMYRHPSVRGLKHLIEFHLSRAAGEIRDDLLMLKSLIEQLVEKKAVYRCSHCGFASRLMHWQCPSCRQWGTVKPIQGVEGE